MTLSELHAAVQASYGPLDDELLLDICALVLDTKQAMEIYDGRVIIWLGELETKEFERPDKNLDAALDLVRVRFPDRRIVRIAIEEESDCARCKLISMEDLADWKHSQPIALGKHKDRRLAIIAALLRAMGA